MGAGQGQRSEQNCREDPAHAVRIGQPPPPPDRLQKGTDLDLQKLLAGRN
jgi:hypothetical protein